MNLMTHGSLNQPSVTVKACDGNVPQLSYVMLTIASDIRYSATYQLRLMSDRLVSASAPERFRPTGTLLQLLNLQ